MNAQRILSHGEITDLTNGFSIPVVGTIDNKQVLKTFTIILFPIDGEGGEAGDVELVNCRCMVDGDFSPYPVTVGVETPLAIVELAADSIDLTKYRVFWGGIGLI